MMDLILLVTCLLTITIATGYDLKWRYIPDYASYSFISIAIMERVLYALELNNWAALYWTLPAAGILIGFGYVLYKGGMWGGGDVKVIASTAIFLAWFPDETIPLFIDFLANLLIVGTAYLLPAAMYKGIKRGVKPTSKEKIAMIIGLGIGLTLYAYQSTIMNGLIFIGLVTITSITYLKRIEEQGFIGPADMKTLMDGDWLIEPVKVGRKTIKPRKEGLTKEEALQIKKWWKQGKLKKRPIIKEGVAYLPAFLFAYIITISIGNIIILMLLEGMPGASEAIKILQ